MADKLITKTISFSADYLNEYKYLMQQDNASKYVCKLIKDDMQGKTNLRDIIRETVKEVLGDRTPSTQADLKDAVNDLFN